MRKGMRKRNLLAALAAACALCFTLVACGGGGAESAEVDASGFVGVWELESMTDAGEVTTEDDLALVRDYGLNVYLVLSDDGTALLDLFGEQMNASWTAETSSEASISFEVADEGDDPSGTLALDGGKLVLSGDEDVSMTFHGTTQAEMDAFLEGSDGLSGLIGDLDEAAPSE